MTHWRLLYLILPALLALRLHLLLRSGSVFVEGVESPFSLMAASRGVYGEAAGEWSAGDALGFSRIAALPGVFYTRAGERAGVLPEGQ